MQRKTALKLALGVIILALILYTVDVRKIASVLAESDKLLIAVAILFTPLSLFIHLLRWEWLVRVGGIKIGFKEASSIYLRGLFLGTLTPSKIGDLLKFRYLHNDHGVPRGTALSISMIDRVFDTLAVIAIAAMALPIVYRTGATNAAIVFAVAAVCLLLIVFSRGLSKKLWNMMAPKFLALGAAAGVGHDMDKDAVFESLYKPFGELKRKPGALLGIGLLSVLIWVVVGTQLFVVLLAVGASPNIMPAVSFFCLATLVGLIPVTLSGLGTREASLVFLFGLVGIAADRALSASLLDLVIGQLSIAVAGGLVYMASKQKFVEKYK